MITAGILLAVLVVVYAWMYWPSSSGTASPEELAEVALNSSDQQEQVTAAKELSDLGEPAIEQLRRVLAESDIPGVRAAVITGLANQRDYDSMPKLLDALEDPSLLVRSRAGATVRRMLPTDHGFGAADPPERRAEVVKRLRAEWERFRESPLMKKWRERKGQERKES
jgi:hypothetical protein